MMKKILLTILAGLLVFSWGVTALAAPASLSSSSRGNVSNLITVKKPESTLSSTTKKNYALSAVGSSGTEVGVYKWNGSSYALCGSGTIGASGIYVRQLSLSSGMNRLAVWAGKGNNSQVVRLEINLVDASVLNGISNYKINIQSVLKGWV